jgi:hypothetical protein
VLTFLLVSKDIGGNTKQHSSTPHIECGPHLLAILAFVKRIYSIFQVRHIFLIGMDEKYSNLLLLIRRALSLSWRRATLVTDTKWWARSSTCFFVAEKTFCGKSAKCNLVDLLKSFVRTTESKDLLATAYESLRKGGAAMRQCGSRNKSGKGHQIGVLQFEKSNPL